MNFVLDILGYLFQPSPVGLFRYMWIFIVFTVIVLAISITLRIILKKRKEDKIFKKMFRSLPGKLQTIAICEALYILARYIRMPYLSMRFLNYLIIGIGIYIVIKFTLVYLKKYPLAKKDRQKQLELNKYLPRKGGK